MDAKGLKSYTLLFKKNVLLCLEENDNNFSKTAREFNIYPKNVQRWSGQKDVILKAFKARAVSRFNKQYLVPLWFHCVLLNFALWGTTKAKSINFENVCNSYGACKF